MFDTGERYRIVYRPGKTARDRASGAHKRNAENKALRSAWTNRMNLSEPFPFHTCNGKRNRRRIGKPVK